MQVIEAQMFGASRRQGDAIWTGGFTILEKHGDFDIGILVRRVQQACRFMWYEADSTYGFPPRRLPCAVWKKLDLHCNLLVSSDVAPRRTVSLRI
jgi:hypothetical protein